MTKADIAILSMSPGDIERFWAKVNREPGQGPGGECHEWTAYRREGYGRFGIGGTLASAHRIAFFLEFGRLPPPGKPLACHTCDNPPCCRGEHLFAGTYQDNMDDRNSKGRCRVGVGERNGRAVLTPALVAEIRALHAATGMGYREIGRRFLVDHSAVRQAILFITWKDVE